MTGGRWGASLLVPLVGGQGSTAKQGCRLLGRSRCGAATSARTGRCRGASCRGMGRGQGGGTFNQKKKRKKKELEKISPVVDVGDAGWGAGG